MSGFTIYTTLTARRLNPSYFKCLKQTEAGTGHFPVGQVMPVLRADYSLLVVRCSHREERQGYHLLTKTKRYWRNYYGIKTIDYKVVSINWDTGFVIELSNHATQKEANAAMIAAHQATEQPKV